MLGKGDLATAVAFVHAANLRNGDMGLVDDAQEIFGEIIDKRIGRLTRRTPIKVARIVLDAAAKAHGLEHFQIVIGAHLQTLGLEQLAFGLELRQPFAQLILDGLQRAVHLGAGRNVMRRRPDGERFVRAQNFARHVVYFGNRLDFVTPKLNANGIVGIGRKHVKRVAAHAKRAARQLVVVAIVLDVNKVVNDIVALGRHLLVQKDRHASVVHRRANTVNAADRRNHDDVAARKQGARCCMAQLFDLFVNGGILLDKRIGRRHIRFGLVIIVIRHEIHDCVFGEELFELGRQLGGQRLVGSHDQRGLLDGLDNLCHGERLTRASDAQQRLVSKALFDALGERLNGLRLVARGLVRRNDMQRRIGKPHLGQLALHFDTFEIGKMCHSFLLSNEASDPALAPF